MRLIDADIFLKTTRFQEGRYPCKDIVEDIESQPIVDAVPVVHGRWLDAPTVAFTEECSVCGFIVFWDGGRPYEYNYCPHCGANMDLEVE